MASPVYDDLDRPALRPQALRRALRRPGAFWTDVQVLAETASTNADVAAAARAGAPEGLVVVAEAQTAGRGRLGRAWVAPPRSGLTFSLLLRPTGPPAPPAERWGWLPLLAGVAVATAVRRVAPVAAQLKWPNDLVVGERKLGGILAERVDEAVVVGIGLNVSLRAAEAPVPEATSLLLEGAASADRERVLEEVLREFATRYDAWRRAGGDAGACGLAAAYRTLSATIGEPVRVTLPGGDLLEGLARGVDAAGRLLVADQALAAGDVQHLRPATGQRHPGVKP